MEHKGSGFKNFPIRLKMVISHGILGVLAVIVAITGIFAIKNQTKNAEKIHTESSYLKGIAEISYSLTEMEKSVALCMLSAEDSSLQREIESNAAFIMQGAKALQASLQGTSGEGMMASYIGMLEEEEAVRNQLLGMVQMGDAKGAYALYEAS